jgi:peptide/nickel transport system substrate-binding protein
MKQFFRSAQRTLALLSILVCALAAIVACPAAFAAKADNTLVVGFPREVTTLDGLYSRARENDVLGLLTDDALYYVDPQTLQAVPLAAKSHKFVNDTTLDVELRPGIKFHDGSEMTAEDVAYSYNWIVSPESKTLYSNRIGHWLKNAEVRGKYLVRFNMKQPNALVFYDFTYYSKIRKKGAYHKADGTVDPNANTRMINGTGPYRVVEFKPDRITLQRFKEYRADSPKGRPPIERIVIRSIPDFSTLAAEVMSGGIQWSFNVPSEIAEDVAKSGRGRLVHGPSMRVEFLVLDAAGKVQPNGPLTKKAVRQALNHAIDRESIVKNLVKGTSKVLFTACNPVQFGCAQDVRKYNYDPARAKKLLAEAGYPNGFELELWGDRERAVNEAIVHQLNQVGIKAKLRYVKGPVLTKARNEKQVAAYYGSIGSFSIPDAGAIVPDHFLPESDRNFSQDPQVAKEVDAANATYDPEKRKQHFREALRRIAEEAYWVPILTFSANYLASNEVEFEPWKDGMERLFQIRWK